MNDWTRLLGDSHEPGELKKQVDAVTVLQALGVQLEDTGHRWEGLCPFHADSNPSFAVWWDEDAESQKMGCWSCDFGMGDIFDAVRRLKKCTLGEAIKFVAEYKGVAPTPQQPKTPKKANVDLNQRWKDALKQVREDDAAKFTLHKFLRAKNLEPRMEWLIEEWLVGVYDGTIVIPHLTEQMDCRAIKRRFSPDWTPMAMAGSKLDTLYGAWRDRGHKHVILAEGESDAWTISWELRDVEVDVLALPHGAGPGKEPHADWLARLKGRQVTIMFDADKAGRISLREWISKLEKPRVAQLPEGLDATEVSLKELRAALATAKQVPDLGPGLEATTQGYRRGERLVSDFTLKLESVVEVPDDELIYEVSINGGQVKRISSSEFTEGGMRKWANPLGRTWFGSTKEAQELLRMLNAEAFFNPKLRGVRTAGWHEGRFVAPGVCIGQEGWAYVPPKADIGLDKHVYLQPEPWSKRLPVIMANLHKPEVLTPMLGWLGAAPMRALFERFPVLAVVGGSGSGKTTLVQEVLRTFGWGYGVTLTQTTPHAVHSIVSATNGVPVWFDEYRRGARMDSKLVLEQAMRDAWTSEASVKGGLQEQKAALTQLAATAPIVVSGEDAFSETSHVERMVIVNMPSNGKNPNALDALRAADREGFGRAYLEWLVRSFAHDTLPQRPHESERQKHARAVAKWGYSLLSHFIEESTGMEMPAYDETRVIREHEASNQVPVFLEVLREFNGYIDGQGHEIVYCDGDDVYARVQKLVKLARSETDIMLPGGSRAMRNWLDDRYGVEDVRLASGRALRLSGARAEVEGE